MDPIVEDFVKESKSLIEEMTSTLEELEGDFRKRRGLEHFGQLVDRIMGAAKSMAMMIDDKVIAERVLNIGRYAEICKAVGYQGSQIEDNEEFYNVVVALLLDASEMLETFFDNLGQTSETSMRGMIGETFLDRLKWISSQFGKDVRTSVAHDPKKEKDRMSQNQVDDLLKQLGLG
jgi:hypothetical protein